MSRWGWIFRGVRYLLQRGRSEQLSDRPLQRGYSLQDMIEKGRVDFLPSPRPFYMYLLLQFAKHFFQIILAFQLIQGQGSILDLEPGTFIRRNQRDLYLRTIICPDSIQSQVPVCN